MTYRQSVWGLARGIVVMSVSGLFWVSLGLGVGARVVASVTGRDFVYPVLAVVDPALFVALLVATFRLRRKAAGFTLSEVRDGDEETRQETRRIVRGFRWVSLIQTILIAMVGLLCYYFERPDLAWPWIALVLGVHFVPLAWLLGVRAYYATGFASSVVALAAITVFEGPHRTLFLGYGMGIVAWLSAVYLLRNAEGIAQQLSRGGKTSQA